MPGCKACGGADHLRRSSVKCARHLPPIRKRKLESGCDVQVYVVKRSLGSLLCPLLDGPQRTRLLEEIKRDVRDLSRLYIELGIFYNLFMKTTQALPPKPDVLQFVYAMKGKGPYAEAYTKYFGTGRRYDGKLRSFTVQELAKQYETTLHTNICTHAYSRLARYFRVKRNDERLYNAYFKKVMPEEEDEISREIARVCATINGDTVKGPRWWSTISEWMRIQDAMKIRSFRLFPQPSHGLKHITYTSRGWHELLRRVAPETVPGDWTAITDHLRQLWAPWLDLPSNTKFGCCLQTDGISVSASMNRIVKEKREPAKLIKKHYDRIVAVDPGSRIPIAAVESKRFTFKRITKKYVRSHTLEWKRERIRNKILNPILDVMQRARASFTFPVSSKNTEHILEYTEFRMQWFDTMQAPYEKHSKLTRFGLDKYMRTAQCQERIVKEVFDGGGVENVLVLYGAGSKLMNVASFSGRKFKHDALLKKLRSKNNITVEIVDEAYTSQACSACNERTGAFIKIGMDRRLRWGTCPVCHSQFDRDANAAKNILINHIQSTLCRPRCPIEKRDIVTS